MAKKYLKDASGNKLFPQVKVENLENASGEAFTPASTSDVTTVASRVTAVETKTQSLDASGNIPASKVIGLAAVATTGVYSDLSGTPTNVSSFTNDAGYLTSHQSLKTINGNTIVGTGDITITGEPAAYLKSISKNTTDKTITITDKNDTATTFTYGDGGGGTSDYEDLINKPQINSVELTGNKTLANLGIQAEINSEHKLSYSLLSDTPTIPTVDVNKEYVDNGLAAKQNTIDSTHKLDYSLLDNTPTIPTVPTKVSAFTNDAGYLTSHQSLAAYRTAADQDTIDATFALKSEIPTIPTNVSAFTNDAGYQTASDVVTAISGKQDHSTLDTDVGTCGYTKNAGTVTSVNNVSPVDGNVTIAIPTVPTKVSAFTNDAGYLTSHQSLAGYATETFVTSQGYITSSYHDATKQDVIDSEHKLSYNLLSDTPTIPDAVSGTSSGDNWTTITIGSVTKNIPAGGGGTSDYDQLSNKPQINSVTLTGNKSLSDLGAQSEITASNKLSYSLLSDTPTIPADATAWKWAGTATNYIAVSSLTDFPNSGALITIVGRIQYCDTSDNKLTFTASYDDLASHGNGTWYTYKVKNSGSFIAGNAHLYWNSEGNIGVYAINDGWSETNFIIERIIVSK